MDGKNTELGTAVRLYTNQKANAAKRYADNRCSAVKSACVLKEGDVMTGDLAMSGHRVTWLPTGASTSEGDAVSMAQVPKVVTDNMTNSST